MDSACFFQNTACPAFPCHSCADTGSFNCLFCYCPLYGRVQCPGKPRYIQKNGRLIKSCIECDFPHRKENYERVIRLLKAAPQDHAEMPLFHHGGELSAWKGKKCSLPDNQPLIDFSVSCNPLGAPAAVRQAFSDTVCSDGWHSLAESYPDSECSTLRHALAARYRIAEGQILCGNGASELLILAVQALSPKKALLPVPSFSGYERALRAFGIQVVPYLLTEENSFLLTEDFIQAIRRHTPDIVFLCTPNNPTGRCIDRGLLLRIADICEETGTFLILDECFLGFVPDSFRLSLRNVAASYKRLLILDAFTKLYGLPGLRLGFCISGNDRLLQSMRILQPEWSVSSFAQYAGTVCLSEQTYLEQTLTTVQTERMHLAHGLELAGFKVYESQANFMLFKAHPDLYDQLLARHICVRSCHDFAGLGPEYFRAAVHTRKDNDALLAAVKECPGV